MNPMKRLGVVAVLALAASLLAPTAADAKDLEWGPWTYELENTGVEPLATGQMEVRYQKSTGGVQWYKVRVTCQNLTAGATYSRHPYGFGTFTAKSDGDLNIAYTEGISGWSWVWFYLYRLDPDGSWTLVLLCDAGP